MMFKVFTVLIHVVNLLTMAFMIFKEKRSTNSIIAWILILYFSNNEINFLFGYINLDDVITAYLGEMASRKLPTSLLYIPWCAIFKKVYFPVSSLINSFILSSSASAANKNLYLPYSTPTIIE